MNDRLATHPSLERLAAFRVGDLSAEELTETERHVADCPSCCQSLQALPDDSLVQRLREAVTTPELGNGATPAESPNRNDAPVSGPAPLAPRPEPVLPTELADHPRYRVLELVGVGGMGAVYKAEHRLMERPVALKVIARHLMDKPGVVERFRREVKAAARLDHPNIVRAYDAERAGDLHFLIMECVEGTTLARLVAERGPLPVAEACEYVRQAALGLQHAFEHGMVHRDVKPQNLMRTPDGQIKILDFGLARFASELGPTDAVTASDTVLGTADYIAPEQADNPRTADTRADVYSLGCTLYFLLTGQPPFPEGTLMQKLMAHSKRTLRPLIAFRDDVPDELQQVLDRMTAKDPTRRYQTPADAGRALAPFAKQDFARSGASVTTEFIRPAPRSRRPRLLTAVAALLLLGVALLSAVIVRITTNKGEIIIEADDPDVEVVVTKSGKVVTILDTKSNQKVTLDTGEYVVSLAGNSDGLKIDVPPAFTLRRGDTKIVTVKREPVHAKVGEVRRFEEHTGRYREHPGRLRIWDGVWGVAFSPNGKQVLSSGDDQFVRLSEVATGRQLWHYEVESIGQRWGRLGAVAFSPDGRLALVACCDHTARLLDVATGKEAGRLEGHKALVAGVSFSPDSRFALTAGGTWHSNTEQDNSVRLWDVATRKELRRFDGHTARVCTAVFSPDGRFVLSASADKTVRLWDAKTCEQLRTFEGHTSLVVCAVFSPDGRQALSSSWDKTFRLWDVATGEELRKFDGHTDKVMTVAFSPDGRRALTASEDGTVRLWDLATGKELYRCTGHTDRVHTAVFSPDDRYALSGSKDGTVRLWRLPDPPPPEKSGENRPVK
jgi:WD40 repeat protein/serine/threonine protein kinase